MSCSQILNGIARDCTASKGGVRRALIANYADVVGITETTDQVSAITMADGATFKEYIPARQASSVAQNAAINVENGSNYVQSDIVLVFNRMETAKRVELKALALNELVVIVEDANGKFWYFGKDEAVFASAADGLTGTARADRNGFSITLQANDMTFAPEVTAEAITNVLG